MGVLSSPTRSVSGGGGRKDRRKGIGRVGVCTKPARTHKANACVFKHKTYSTGIVLVHGYLRIDADLVLPKVRAQIESECTLIAKGQVRGIGRGGQQEENGYYASMCYKKDAPQLWSRNLCEHESLYIYNLIGARPPPDPQHMHTQKADMQSVVEHSLKNFKAKFRYFAEHIDLMDSLFEATFSPLVR